MRYKIEYTDTFAGEANYCWVTRHTLDTPELTTFGYDGGSNYCEANRRAVADLKRRAKASVSLTGVRGEWEDYGDSFTFRPRGMCTVLFVTFDDGSND